MPTDDAPRLCRVAGRDAWHIYHRRRRVSTGSASRAEAELVLSEYKRGLTLVRSSVLALSDVLARYLVDRRERMIPGLERLEYAHKPLVRIMGHKPPEAMGEADARGYVARRGREGVAVATIRTELQALKAALRWAAGNNLINGAPAIVMPPRPEGRVRWLTRAEAERLIAACHAPHIKLFIIIALNTGARSGAILSLTWDRVDFASRTVDFRVPGVAQTKKRKTLASMNETLYAALAQAKDAATSESVIEWAGGSIEKVKHGFRDTATRAGLKGVTPHTLRHTAVSWLLQKGVSVWDVAGFVGMTVDMVQTVYGHHSEDGMRRVARALG